MSSIPLPPVLGALVTFMMDLNSMKTMDSNPLVKAEDVGILGRCRNVQD